MEASLAASCGSALRLQGASAASPPWHPVSLRWACGDDPAGNPGRIPCLRDGPAPVRGSSLVTSSAGELPGYIPCRRWACGGPPWLHRLRSLIKITSRLQKRFQSRYFSRLQRDFPRKFVKFDLKYVKKKHCFGTSWLRSERRFSVK